MNTPKSDRSGRAEGTPEYDWSGRVEGTPECDWSGRVEDVDLLCGRVRYAGDLDGSEPDGGGAWWVGFVRSPVASAEIAAIDTAAAEALDGVIGVYTATDVTVGAPPAVDGVTPAAISPPALAEDRVAYVGQAVAAVVAESEAVAADAGALVEVTYRSRLPVADLLAASAPDAPLVHPAHSTNTVLREVMGPSDTPPQGPAGPSETPPQGPAGPSDTHPQGPAGPSETAIVVSVAQHIARVACAPLEGVAALVVPEGERLTVWLNTQMPSATHDGLVAALGLPDDHVRVVVPPIGGGFGGKCSGENGLVAVVARLALRLGRPLRLSQTRAENLLSMQARDQDQRISLKATVDGRVTTMDAEVNANVGGYAGLGAFEPLQTQRLIPGPYRVDQVAVTAAATITTTAPTGPYRGPGRAEAIALLERAMDTLARTLDLDPADVRRRNLLRPEDFPRTLPSGLVMDEADHLGALERALTEVGYRQFRAHQADRRAAGDHRLVGIGLCCWADFTGRHEPCQPATVRVRADGRIEIDAGVAPLGQGMGTPLGELVARELGIPRSLVASATPDTGRHRQAPGSFGSRSASLAGSSAAEAATRIREELQQRAAERLEAAPHDIEIRANGTLGVRGTPHPFVALAELAGTEATAAFDQAQPTFPGGTHVAVVEVDIETGGVELMRHLAVTDCGRVLSPVQAAGQVHGGAVQGIAAALFEEMSYDADANPLTTTLADYLMPAACELPAIETVFLETPTDRNPLGAKGVAESGTIGAAPAVQGAVIDALAHLGVTHIDMPCTPERVWLAVRTAMAGRQGHRTR
ncbi:xanthine dehydrogenase family protein molybdopterin-binding subunit [Candidatus Poriferisocius sp.]|uniref:xanthine dehydrogenase family protein molybdopterin-binding subunit n=1 Tax=Candidatus Poriferisocius sp. TaxID=3101276 RepID=UPI003B59F670